MEAEGPLAQLVIENPIPELIWFAVTGITAILIKCVTGWPIIYHGTQRWVARAVARGPLLVALRKADGTPWWQE